MDAAELDYDLPAQAIAQRPIEPRDAARLLVDQGPGQAPAHRRVADLADLVAPGDLVVVNDTKVIPARLRLHKATGGAVEVLLLERHAEGWWEALVKPSRRVAPGTVLTGGPGTAGTAGTHEGSGVRVVVGEVLGDDGRRRVDLGGGHDHPASTAGPVRSRDLADDLSLLAEVGEVPLPPYIGEPLADPGRYQTVFAAHPGSVAAPTAGLHLTDGLLGRLSARGARVLRVELVVGLGTFRPITTDRVEDHPMHAERYRIPPETVDALRSPPGRVLAVGTTVVRALESWAATSEVEDSTGLFIRGDYPFRVVDRLLTNFHVPRSSLLALVQAFIGPRWHDLYATALAEHYRFLSFGDAMLLDRVVRG